MDKQDSEKLRKAVADLSRRDFIAASVAAGLAAAAGSTFAAAQPVVETERGASWSLCTGWLLPST